jgi:hypothetical protein
MARPPDGMTSRTEVFSLRTRPQVVATLDRLRGQQPRSPYIEKLIIEEDRRRRQESTEKK